MVTPSNNPLLLLTQDNIDAVNQFYGIDEKRLNESLDSIEEWLKKQEHLVEASKYMDRGYIARLFVLARGSTENTKNKIEKILTLRSLMPELCLIKSASEFENVFDFVKYAPLPIISLKDNTRVIVIQLEPNKVDEFSTMHLLRYANTVSEYRLHFDCFLGERLILDMRNVSIISKINPILLRKVDVLSEAYGAKIKGIHVINAPTFVDPLLRLLKQTLRAKVASRLYLHNTYEEIHEHIAKEVLPEDFGGDEMSMEKLCEKWKEYLKTDEAAKLIDESNHIISDESKRNNAQFNEKYMGIPGSFRQLTVD